MSLSTILDALAALCLLGGASMSLAAAIGLVRFPDLLSRMHSATKPQVLGLLLMLIALALMLRSWVLVPVLLLAWVFQLLTAPVSAHMVGRAGYRTKHLRKELLTTDELDEVVEAAAAYSAEDYKAAARTGTSIREASLQRARQLLPEGDPHQPGREAEAEAEPETQVDREPGPEPGEEHRP